MVGSCLQLAQRDAMAESRASRGGQRTAGGRLRLPPQFIKGHPGGRREAGLHGIGGAEGHRAAEASSPRRFVPRGVPHGFLEISPYYVMESAFVQYKSPRSWGAEERKCPLDKPLGLVVRIGP